ncbi:hypothetical protein [Cytobacillus gottheilii]|uniref:Phage abortive infection protein n=1 Tax=Cytobacillus gottheilii TaxID=859144 RepID=A0ABX8FBP7_9BACI|nr:hypothetical protein [Cytobacillus gottheilii]QVY61283.1 hypothetical protein J1899_20385 [Cytobacillus gottheilii]
MDFINFKNIIFDNSLIIAIIAINMTIIGLTSLAETRKVIGVDYGKFLVKKYRLFNKLRIYELLIVFAIINVSSLFLMFVETFQFRLINSILLMVSLIFAIYYFFAYIISENKLVKRQIYEDELVGLYFESDNLNHQETDVLTEMTGGSRTNKKLSSNVINYFNTYNSESQNAFEEIFGVESLLYDYSKRSRKKLKRKYQISPYIYRNNSNGIHDISYEYFQLFRSCELQDKWTIEILRIFDGDRQISKKYEPLRLYNFARVMTHLNLFGHCDQIYKYKFLEYVIQFYYNTVLITDEEIASLNTIDKSREVEKKIFRQLVKFMFDNENNQRDSTFNEKAKHIIEETILKDTYKGLLGPHELILLLLEKTLEINTFSMRNHFTDILDKYYYQMHGKEIPEAVKINRIKTRILEHKMRNQYNHELSMEELFGEELEVVGV